ncbi:inverted formin-2-like [Monomorium pharaonis]|uniref:inverted formin-2-like n=1 Tax=Monomorium pharaonis TaxID=307658 RepID=UPI00174753CC|nr:inverted formin-2-like [Monomorium pharaonis]
MGKCRSTLRERLARAIARPPRIPVSKRPFEATARPSQPKQPNDQATDQPPASGQGAPAPTPQATRRPPTIRQRTVRSRQERLYDPAPDNVATARQATLLATFGSTLSDLDDDDDNEVTAEHVTPAPAPMPDIASLTITEPSTAPPEDISSAPPSPSVLPTPPPTPLPTPPAPLPAPGYFTGPPPPTTAPTASPLPGPLIPLAAIIPEGPFPEDALRTVPWDRIRPGQRYRHHGHKIIVRRRRDGSWLVK